MLSGVVGQFSDSREHAIIRGMQAWDAYTLRVYYQNPRVAWLEGGTKALGGPLPIDGYYVLGHSGDPERFRPAGPFKGPHEAREWSRQHLVL